MIDFDTVKWKHYGFDNNGVSILLNKKGYIEGVLAGTGMNTGAERFITYNFEFTFKDGKELQLGPCLNRSTAIDKLRRTLKK